MYTFSRQNALSFSPSGFSFQSGMPPLFHWTSIGSISNNVLPFRTFSHPCKVIQLNSEYDSASSASSSSQNDIYKALNKWTERYMGFLFSISSTIECFLAVGVCKEHCRFRKFDKHSSTSWSRRFLSVELLVLIQNNSEQYIYWTVSSVQSFTENDDTN